MLGYAFIIFTIACLTYALVKKRFIFLLVPIAAIMLYVAFEIVMVPMPLADTLKFIFSLR